MKSIKELWQKVSTYQVEEQIEFLRDSLELSLNPPSTKFPYLILIFTLSLYYIYQKETFLTILGIFGIILSASMLCTYAYLYNKKRKRFFKKWS